MRYLILAALCLGGCASTQSVMSSQPIEVIHSNKSVDAVVFCLQNKMDAPVMELDGAKVLLQKTGLGVVTMVFSVRPEGSGSVTELRKGSMFGGALRKCF